LINRATLYKRLHNLATIIISARERKGMATI